MPRTREEREKRLVEEEEKCQKTSRCKTREEREKRLLDEQDLYPKTYVPFSYDESLVRKYLRALTNGTEDKISIQRFRDRDEFYEWKLALHMFVNNLVFVDDVGVKNSVRMNKRKQKHKLKR